MDGSEGYVALAYMGLWGIISVYLIFLGIRTSALKKEVNLLNSLVKKSKGS